MIALKHYFLIDSDVIFLNHGSFGACPRPVFEVYQDWQKKLERQPVEFLGRKVHSLLADSRSVLAAYLGCKPEELVYFPNPTTAINMVARNLDLQPGDEILTTDHEYGAMDRTWRYTCQKTGAKYVQQHVALPTQTQDEFVELFWKQVTSQTRVIFMSHITSPTALIFPVAEICRRARQAGILTIIDGAHAPGQIPINLEEIGADLYTGACHKWMMSPKGASFLFARPEVQEWLDPLVISWGYDADPGFGSGNRFIDYHEWQGTRDMAAFLTVPAAIEFMADNQWIQVSKQCHQSAMTTRRKICEKTGLPPICPENWCAQMFTACLPETDTQVLGSRLYETFRIEVPVLRYRNQPFIRVSIQGYNTQTDLDTLLDALDALL